MKAETMKQIVLSACCLLLAASMPAVAGDAEAGKKKSTPCAACHGPDGSTPTGPDFPRLGGQYYDYLVKTLEGYKSGARKNPIMNPLAANLTQRDIEDLAAFFSSQRGLVTKY
jgi:cytochrome c553